MECPFSFFHTTGIEIDLNNKKFRNTFDLFSLSFGKWNNLPKVEYISVFKTRESSVLRAITAETVVKNEIIKINLFYDSNKKITAYVTQNKEDAFKKAKEISVILDVDILDATEREYKWL